VYSDQMTRRTMFVMPVGFVFGAMVSADIKALTFDVFGSVVDWRSSIIREGEALTRARGIKADWAKFADAWRAGYGPAISRVRKGELPWTRIDVLHRLVLDRRRRFISIVHGTGSTPGPTRWRG
jgi:hypothetical protein